MRGLRGVLAVAFVAHGVAVGGTQFPRDSVLRAYFDRVFTTYLKASGNWQSWDMFDSAPNYHAYRVVLAARMPNGETQEFPALLPGLIPQDNYVRNSTYFLRTIDGAYSVYFTGYAKRACAEVAAKTGVRPESVFARQYIERTRQLPEVRSDGVVATKQTTDGKMHACEPVKGATP